MVTLTAPVRDRTRRPQRVCPRCASALIITYDEPECLPCGYVDYKYVPPTPIGKKSLMSAGTRFVLRYVGDSSRLTETLVNVQLKRLRHRIVYAVSCPFCKGEMEQSSLSGKRRELREERYKCSVGHRISLIPNRDGRMGWK